MADTFCSTRKPVNILVVEDEWSIQKLLQHHLEGAGYDLTLCDDADQAWDSLAEQLPDVILLDWMLPGQSGMEMLRDLRAEGRTKDILVIMLTARASEQERINGLDRGADDYIGKPFNPRELLARIRALLRRSQHREAMGSILHVQDVFLNTHECLVKRAGEAVHLGPTEYRLLEFFMQSPGRIYSREQLLDGVWGRDNFVDERTVDVHIRRLRKALCQFGGENLIRTVRNMGYGISK